MPCYRPISLPVKHKPTTKGERAIWAERTLPCGTCLGCRAAQALAWTIRLNHETQLHSHAWFLTLTYNEDTIPEHGSLDPQHLRAFFKSLRKNYPAGSISYFACGEYGTRTQRPHYHALLFGSHFLDKYLHRTGNSHVAWRADSLESHWELGHSEFSAVTPASIAYVAGYVQKKLTTKQAPDQNLRVDPASGELHQVAPQFNRMSLRPAIGKRWIEKFWKEVYPKDRVVFNGGLYPPPRYYDKWMDEHQPEIMADVRYTRDQEATYLEPEKLAAKEKIHISRNNLKGPSTL